MRYGYCYVDEKVGAYVEPLFPDQGAKPQGGRPPLTNYQVLNGIVFRVHTGGYWIKLLSQLENLYVYHAQSKNPRDTEFKMLMYFIEESTGESFYELEELGIHLPFANLKVDFQKKHNISNAVQKKIKK